MKIEKPEDISESVILETLSNNPSDFKVCAIGDKKRYNANLLLLGDNCRYEKNETIINKENTDVLVICGEYQPSNQIKSNDIPMIYLYQLISYKAKKFWDSKKEYIGIDLNHYCSNPYICKYIDNYRKKINSISLIKKYYEKNRKHKLKLLSIGCGYGHFERKLLETGFFSEIHGCDISPESIQVAKDNAEEIDKNKVITYFTHDINTAGWEKKYDVIIAFSCVHHIERLEFFYENVRKALKSNGIFIQEEYVGAVRFQNSYITIGVVNFLLKLLPPKIIKNNYKNIGMQEVLTDPSEAVRSDEIIPLTKRIFPKTKIWEFPGVIMHLLYRCVNADEFHTNEKRTKKLCLLIFKTEKLLDLIGLVEKDVAILVSEAKL